MGIERKGLFITIEGADGVGKTTVSLILAKLLEKKGYGVLLTREPGGSSIAEQIREILLDSNNDEMDGLTEAILYTAARRQHLVDKVLPALQENKIVLCDRFIDSSLAYQGEARGLGLDLVENLNLIAIQDCKPDLTLYLETTPEVAQARIIARKELNRLDKESEEFHQRVRKGFEKAISRDPSRFERIDTSKNPDEVAKDCLQALQKHFSLE